MLNDIEKEILESILEDEAWGHVEYLSTLDKTSGTEGEREAHEYVRGKLREYGVPFKEYEFDSYLSHPLEATLEEFAATIHPHPTVSEALAEAALAAEGRAIHSLKGYR